MKNFYILLLSILCFTFAKAQIIENFSDGDITNNPTWQGDIDNFTVLGTNILRSNSSIAGTYFITTTFDGTSTLGKEWQISVRHNLASSTTNFSRIYLASNAINLNGSLAGYYLQLGEANATDVVELFRQNGNTRTSLMRGTTTIASAFNIDIKISCSYSGLWQLFVKTITNPNFGLLENTFQDNTNTIFNYFSILTTYTATNRLNFLFDNITVTSLPDITPPTIIGASVLGFNHLKIQFDKNIDLITATTTGNYKINNGINPTNITFENNRFATISFSGITFLGINNLTINGIKDLNNNEIASNTIINFSYTTPTPIISSKYRDIVINEIFADVSPPIGLPAVEYLEIYNNTTQVFNLQNYVLVDGTTNRTINYPVSILGNEYAIIVASNSNKSIIESVISNIKVITLSGFGLTDGGESLKLKNQNDNLIDSLTYTLNWHNEATKKTGGWSLELINPTTTCSGSGNWGSSVADLGGTPGSQNSIYTTTISAQKPFIKNYKLTNTVVTFAVSETVAEFSSNAIFTSTAIGFSSQNIQNDSIKLVFNAPLQIGNRYPIRLQNIQNCNQNILLDTTIIIQILRKANAGEVIITEIYADESPSNGLPFGEFVEIYNTTNNTLDLSGFKLKDATTTSGATIPNLTKILPNEYIILTSTANASAYSVYGKTVGLPSFPSLNSTGDNLFLVSDANVKISEVFYLQSWHSETSKKEGGWSLELINPTTTCSGSGNWGSSVADLGGTPGGQNSIYTTTISAQKPVIKNYKLTNTAVTFAVSEAVAEFSSNAIFTSTAIGFSSQNIQNDSIKLVFNAPLQIGNRYPIRLQNIQNCNQNILLDTTIIIQILRKANAGEVIITEIYADESPSNGLPFGEFVEIYNTTNNTLDLSGFKLKDATTTSGATIPNLTKILPNEYIILTSTANASAYSVYGKTVGLPSFPSLNSTGDNLFLVSDANVEISKVFYLQNWHSEITKKEGGWSLELINPTTTCSGSGNWGSSVADLGGTPGSQNSIYTTTISAQKPFIKNYKLTNTAVTFAVSEAVAEFSSNAIFTSTAIGFSSQNIQNDSIKLVFNAPLQIGNRYPIRLQNIQNCNQNILLDTTIIIQILRKANAGEVIITEIYADESPSNGLPFGEFVEIYNTTNNTLDLSGFKLRDATTTSGATIPNLTKILPNEYIILTSTANATAYSVYGKTVGLPSFPSLNSTGDNLFLVSDANVEISKVFYLQNWHIETTKSDGGWSLELINPTTTCSGSGNWGSSVADLGGTPGSQNSIYTTTISAQKPFIKNYKLTNTAVTFAVSEAVAEFSSNAIFTSTAIGFSSQNIQNDSIKLVFNAPLQIGNRYPIRLQNIQNCNQNILLDTTIIIQILRKANAGEVIITEIYADESPSNGLPFGEFVEIYNTTNNTLDLSGFKLRDATTTSGATIPNLTKILPNEYIILTSTANASAYSVYGKTVGLPSFPSLNSDGDGISLVDIDGTVISAVTYSKTWYADQVKQDGGFSLEKIDIKNPCETNKNWAASVNSKGGTPGKPNSIFAENPDTTPPTLISAFATDSNKVELVFDDIIDKNSFSKINIILPISFVVNEYTILLDRINMTVSSNFNSNKTYTISTTGIKDCALNMAQNTQIASFVLPQKAVLSDLVINEILFNPFTGGSDFVEIYNKSSKNINLNNLKLANLNTKSEVSNYKNITTSNYILAPNSFVVFTDNVLNITNTYPKSVKNNFIEMSALPTFADDDGNVLLLNADSSVIDKFYYKDDYHYALLDKKEGVSLERISVEKATNLPENWQSAAATVGYATPGYKNSQSKNEFETPSQLILADPLVFSPDEDGYKDFSMLQCQLPDNGYTISVYIFSYDGEKIKTIATNVLSTQNQYFKWDGLDDNNNKAKIGSYMILLEGFNLVGQKIKFTSEIVVAGKF